MKFSPAMLNKIARDPRAMMEIAATGSVLPSTANRIAAQIESRRPCPLQIALERMTWAQRSALKNISLASSVGYRMRQRFLNANVLLAALQNGLLRNCRIPSFKRQLSFHDIKACCAQESSEEDILTKGHSAHDA